ncbi:MAG: hypothetical protein IJE54_01775 [Peptococcaceae bacterium]|nr:hypothetical protein [Peptococcaceae bacterium]
MQTRNIKELNRQVAITENFGMVCGPCAMTAIDAEIEIEENDEKLYLFAQWVYACDEELVLKITKESLFPLYTNPDLTDEIGDETNRILNDEIVCDFKAPYPERMKLSFR